MTIIGIPTNIDFGRNWYEEPSEAQKSIWKMERTMADMKRKQEQFLREREEKERRLLYAIAEKLGIDTENI